MYPAPPAPPTSAEPPVRSAAPPEAGDSAPEEAKKRKEKIPAGLKRAVWNYYVGEPHGLAYCFAGCHGLISQTNFACGHLVAEKHGGRLVLQNLRPICTTCNSSMGTANMDDYMREHGLTAPDTRRRVIKVTVTEPCCALL